MNEQDLLDFPCEVERYELYADALLSAKIDRRAFFRIVGGGLVVAFVLTDTAMAQRPGGRGNLPREIGAWLHIGEDNKITVYTGKTEIGQNIRTSLAQVVAEELRLKPDRVHMVMADTELVPFDGGTAGSQTTPQMASQLRRVAAAAREELLTLAADQGKVEEDTLKIADGKIVGPKETPSFTLGELTKGKKVMKLIGEGT